MSKQDLIWKVSNAIRYSQNLGDAFDEIVCKAIGINRTDHRCIDILDQRGPQTAGDLATAARVSPAAITSAIDRLEKKDLVERFDDANDRRKTLVKTTSHCAEVMTSFYQPLYEMFMSRLAALSTEQLEFVLQFYEGEALVDYEAHIEKIRKQYNVA